MIGYLAYARAAADSTSYEWWRAPALIVGIYILGWAARKILMALDFVGDVAGYIGSGEHRAKAEQTLLRFVREVARRAPQARILLVGHSLGSVLVPHALLHLPEDEDIGSRLGIVTMGSPLRLMHWFFPVRIRGPEQLLSEYKHRNLTASWINLWRDADWIGRALRASSPDRYAETSLGNGTHPGYWSDPRCWAAVVKSLRAIANRTWADLVSEWASTPMSELDERELQRRAQLAASFALTANILIVSGPVYFWHQIREQDWLSGFDPLGRYSILALNVVITVLVGIYYYFSSKRVGGHGVTRREMMARYRLNWSIAIAGLKVGAAVSVVTGFVYWRSMAS